MLITIDTNKRTVEVLNEDTKDWEKAYLQDLQYNCSVDSFTSLQGTVTIPTTITHTLDFELTLPQGKY
jgi:hypothetical protein